MGNIKKNLNKILFYSSTDNVPLPQGGFKISKNWTPKYFSTVSVSHLINRNSSRYLWFIWCLYRHIYPHVHKKKICYMITVGRSWRLFIWRRLRVTICKPACSTVPCYLLLYGKKEKTADFDIPWTSFLGWWNWPQYRLILHGRQ